VEIEVKIKVDDFKALKDKILAQGARLSGLELSIKRLS